MSRSLYLANAVLWAVAIITAAACGAPTFFTLGLLPALAGIALLATAPACQTTR